MATILKPLPDLAAQLGATVQALRKQRGLNQAQLARAAGYSRASVASIEAGMILPPLEKLCQLAAALGIEPGSLLGGAQGAGQSVPPPVLTALRRWSPAERLAILRYLRLMVAELEHYQPPA